MGECSGQCCKSFIFGGIELSDLIDEDFNYPEKEKIQEMLLYKGRMTLGMIGYQNNISKNTPSETFETFTCKNLDLQTGKCKDYDNRPSFCREHGESYECQYEGCTLNKKEDS